MKREHLVLKAAAKAGDEEGVLEFVASTGAPDRHNDTINQGGWVFADGATPFLWAHDHDTPPLGTITGRSIAGNELHLTVRFDLDDPFAASIYRKYTADPPFMDAVSVGFKPLDAEPNDHGGVHFKRQELLELSAVPVGAHQDARSKADQDEGDLLVRKWALEVLKAYGVSDDDEAEAKDGRVIRSDLYDKLVDARDRLDEVLEAEPRSGDKDADDGEAVEKGDDEAVEKGDDGEDEDPYFELEKSPSDDELREQFFELEDKADNQANFIESLTFEDNHHD